ncbi:unnamed protein product [Brassica rapa]|uniref:Cation-transporting P-type ATPase C-terminal domain-containing protein n=2 Tax=Brassica TaxID=3705 RepID=A0A8D9GRY6_BRACM|nr:unnamed protein product [Brassica napus]CAG7885366.1 unnamed protein product [Brassica rapa]CDY29559.1 BnaA03g54040D [Brassica napus]
MGLYSFVSLIPSSTVTLYFGNSSSAQYFKNGIEEMARRTLRCVALAFRTYELEKPANNAVRMVTGDNVQTARAIALECGILTSDADASEPNLGMGACIRLNMKPHENWKQLFSIKRSSSRSFLRVMQDMYLNLFFGDEVFKYFRSYDS